MPLSPPKTYPRRPFVWPLDIEGYCGEVECRALYDLACQVPEEEYIVELGAYKGRTAVAMALSGHRVYTVDRFEAEHEEFNPLPDHRSGQFSGRDVYRAANEYGVNVTVLEGTTKEAWYYWLLNKSDCEIGLLFIDADHHYEAVKRDWMLWSKLLTEDAVVVFDDSIFPGVWQLLLEIDDWEPVPGPQPGSLTVMRRIKGAH